MTNIVSLYDESGNAMRPWAEAGFNCYCYDILNENRVEHVGRGVIHFVKADLFEDSVVDEIVALKPSFVCGWPPCTDLAVSGAAWFAEKARRNPNYRKEAMQLVMRVPEIARACGTENWFFENPVSVISSEFRKPDYVFHPFQYGGYLPQDDVHPRWPDYIEPRDRYRKKTCIWSGPGFIMPEKREVECPEGYSKQHRLLGGKSEKTKQIRSEGPRGFCIAVFLANSGRFVVIDDLL